MKRAISIAFVAFLLNGPTTLSAEIDQLSVIKNGKTFTSEAVFVVAAPRDAVLRAITDFGRLSALNPAIVASNVEVLNGGVSRVTTEIRDCVAFFCRSVTMVEDVTVDALGTVHSQVVPGRSDFSAGQTVWQFTTIESTTRVHYRSQIEPDFWLPPLLGTGAFRRALKRQIRVAAANLETMLSGPSGARGSDTG